MNRQNKFNGSDGRERRDISPFAPGKVRKGNGARVTALRRKMEQILNGEFEYEVPKLILSCEKIQRTVKRGEDCRGEIFLGTEDNRKLKGYANSNHRRLALGMNRFSGSTVRLPYGIDTEGLSPGDAFEGKIVLSTNVGEYQIPYSISVEKDQLTSHGGEIRTPQEFARLAKEDFRDAFRLFTNENFGRHLTGNSAKDHALYLGMSKNPVTYQHLEEYLIASGAKEPVRIHLKEEKASFYQIHESIQEEAAVYKSGWGHLRLEVETQGDFLEVPKKVVTEDDFIGSTYGVEYIIHREMLGHGRHFGKIFIRSPYETVVYQIVASKDKEARVNMNIREKKYKLALMEEYLRMRLGKSQESVWLAESFHVIGQLIADGLDYPEYQLYEAYLYYRRDELPKAQEILKRYQDKSFTKDDLELAGIYLYLCYLTGLLKKKEEVCRKVRSFYQQKRDSFPLFWVLLNLDEAYEISPSDAVFELEELFRLGCRSPLLYLEAWKMVEKDMSLLHRLGGVWNQVFLFAAREGLLEEELSMRLAYLSGYEKRFSRSLYRALCIAYEAHPTDDILDAICKHIMKGDPRRGEYFKWYALAVERGLRLTRLYEYYIETMNTRSLEQLPLALRMYFTYNNALSDQKKAYVYANVVHHKEEDPDTFENYREVMKEFAGKKLLEGKINEDYAVLYQEFAAEPADGQEAEALGKMLFTYRLYCDDKKIRHVVVRHSQMQEEEVYPCVDGVAYPRIYSEDAVVLFADERQRRYVTTVDYNLRKLMDETKLLPVCMERNVAEPGFLLSMCQDGHITEENLELYRRLEEQPAFSAEYRMESRRKLLDYYVANADKESMDRYLKQMDYQAFARVDKKKLLELLIDRGMYEDAYEVFGQFGGEGVCVESLLKLCSRMVLEKEQAQDEELVHLAEDIYTKGKYDDVLLLYLLKYYQGSQNQMFSLWESARGFCLDTYAYEEKLLLLCMFVGDDRAHGAKVLEAYVTGLGKECVIKGYLTFAAYESFSKGRRLQPFVRKCLKAAIEREWEMDLVCRLTLLQSYARNRDWNAKQEPLVRQLLGEAISRGIVLSCYHRFPPQFLSPWQLDDKVFVEARTAPDASVTVYYFLDTGLGNEPEYKSEPLHSRYPGVFTKTFTLFYGETLHYYFVENVKGKERKISEKVISMNRIDEEGQNKYQQLNGMLAARRLGKEPEVIARLKEFLRQDHYVKEMYIIEKE